MLTTIAEQVAKNERIEEIIRDRCTESFLESLQILCSYDNFTYSSDSNRLYYELGRKSLYQDIKDIATRREENE